MPVIGLVVVVSPFTVVDTEGVVFCLVQAVVAAKSVENRSIFSMMDLFKDIFSTHRHIGHIVLVSY
jgi:hypothetical protein